MVNGPSPGPAPADQAPGQQLPADPIQLADMAPPETAQEGPQGGWRLDYAADGASRPAGAQHVGVVNAVSSGQSRSHQRHHLVAGVGSAWGATQVQVPVNQFGQAQMPAQRGWQDQPSIGHQAVVVKAIWMRSGWSSASIFWVLLAWGRFPVSKAIIPDAQEHFLTPSAHRDTHLFGGLGVTPKRRWVAAAAVPENLSATTSRAPPQHLTQKAGRIRQYHLMLCGQDAALGTGTLRPRGTASTTQN